MDTLSERPAIQGRCRETGYRRHHGVAAAAVVLMVVVWACGCNNARTFSGRYTEVELQDSIEDEFVLGLDLFQFGDEVGGIVRYYSPLDLDLNDPLVGGSVFQTDERLCFWSTRSGVGDQFTLLFLDEYGVVNELRITSQDNGDRLTAELIPRIGAGSNYPEEADPRRSEPRRLNFTRAVEGSADSSCVQTPEQFRMSIIDVERELGQSTDRELTGSRCSTTCVDPGAFCDPRTGDCIMSPICQEREAEADLCEATLTCNPYDGECVELAVLGRFDAALVWLGSRGSEQNALVDWARPIRNFEPSGAFVLERNLPPGWWGEAVPLTTIGSGVSVALGVVVAFRNDDVDVLLDTPGNATPDLDVDSELIVGTAFREAEAEVCGGVEGARFGRVVLFIDGDLGDLQEVAASASGAERNFLDLFPEGALGPIEGYAVYDACISTDTQVVFRLSRTTAADAVVRVRALTSLEFDTLTLPRLAL